MANKTRNRKTKSRRRSKILGGSDQANNQKLVEKEQEHEDVIEQDPDNGLIMIYKPPYWSLKKDNVAINGTYPFSRMKLFVLTKFSTPIGKFDNSNYTFIGEDNYWSTNEIVATNKKNGEKTRIKRETITEFSGIDIRTDDPFDVSRANLFKSKEFGFPTKKEYNYYTTLDKTKISDKFFTQIR
jgi:hypothetical protein